MTSLLPESFLNRLHTHAVAGARNDLADLLELRDYLKDGEAEGREVVAQMKREAAAKLLVGRWSVERSLWIMRDYTKEQLEGWLSKEFSMHHIEIANREYEVGNYASPADLIEDAIEFGNAEGKPMNCAEFYDFATGNAERPPVEVKLIRLYQSYLKRFKDLGNLLEWDSAKRAEFERDFKTLWERYTK
jgi:hypothetical protein